MTNGKEFFDWLARLISYNTVSSHSNLALINDVKDYLSAQGIEAFVIPAPVEEKANLFATIPAVDHDGGLILSGHTDVVPVTGQTWDSDPFTAVEKNGLIYGRGACDMKGFLAVVLALVPAFKQLRLKKPLHFAFSYDEETGCDGAPLMIEAFTSKGLKPGACIVGEPSMMKVVVAHKGINLFRCRIHGNAAHSSLTPKGCNAIDYAAELIAYIKTVAQDFERNGPFDKHYDVAYTTVSTNMISGGNALNIIPGQCELYFDCRNLPGDAPREIHAKVMHFVNDVLLPRMREKYSAANITVEAIASAPSFEALPQTKLGKTLQTHLDQTEILKVAYATEAGLFQNVGIDTVICGPGSIEQAHRPNEFVSMEQLQLCADMLRKTVQTWCG